MVYFCSQICVGDILCIGDGEDFPADMVILSTSFPNGKANIMTTNLDGETNLKVHTATNATKEYDTPGLLKQLSGYIECENPNADLQRFIGRLKIFEDVGSRPKSVALAHENVVLRGAKLKNTQFMYGCVVYTGQDTKMSHNSKISSNKFSTVEKSMNKYLIFYMILLLLEVLVATLLKYLTGIDRPDVAPWYLTYKPDDLKFGGKKLSEDVLSFLVLFNYIIPISLYVTLEVK